MKQSLVNILPYGLLIASGWSMTIAFLGASDTWLFISGVCGFAAVLVAIALARTRATSLGLIGPALFVLLSVLLIISGTIGLFVSATYHDASIRIQTQNRLRRIGDALLDYTDNQDERRLPPAALRDTHGKPVLSWRVAILPYLGEKDLFERFNLNEAWDSPHNISLVALMPEVFAPAQKALIAVPDGMTHWQVLVGEDTAFGCPKGCSITSDFPAGLSDTILLVEATQPVPWTKPDDAVFSVDSPVPNLGFRPPPEACRVLFKVPTTPHVFCAGCSVESLAQDDLAANDATLRKRMLRRNRDRIR